MGEFGWIGMNSASQSVVNHHQPALQRTSGATGIQWHFSGTWTPAGPPHVPQRRNGNCSLCNVENLSILELEIILRDFCVVAKPALYSKIPRPLDPPTLMEACSYELCHYVTLCHQTGSGCRTMHAMWHAMITWGTTLLALRQLHLQVARELRSCCSGLQLLHAVLRQLVHHASESPGEAKYIEVQLWNTLIFDFTVLLWVLGSSLVDTLV